MVSAPAKPEAKAKKRKKKDIRGKESAEDGIKLKKLRRGIEMPVDEGEEY